jgi:hypothetical protein
MKRPLSSVVTTRPGGVSKQKGAPGLVAAALALFRAGWTSYKHTEIDGAAVPDYCDSP